MSVEGREVARRVLRRVESDGAFVSIALSHELERGGVSERERALATELCYGVIRHRTRIDRSLEHYASRGIGKLSPKVLMALRVAAYQILFLDRVPAHAAVNDAVKAVRRVAGARVAGFANGLLRKLDREGEAPREGLDVRAAVMVEHSMPASVVDLLLEAVGLEELAEAAAGLNASAPMWIRTNTLAGTTDDLVAVVEGEGATVLAQKGHALAVRGLGSPSNSASFCAGRWTVQDLGAQVVGEMCLPKSGQRILDACAGVGGKAGHLAQMAAGQVEIVAVDRSANKLALLDSAASRLGLTGIRTVVQDLLEGPLAEQPFDTVLVDAPCSGLGVLRRHPEAKWRLADLDLRGLAEVQGRLLDTLAPLVKPGGRLVYAVCSFTTVEGRDVISAFLEAHEDFQLARPGVADEYVDANGFVRTWPHRHNADAFFAAAMTRQPW